MRKAILLLIFFFLAIPLLLRYFEVNQFQAYASGSSSYQLMITDTDIAAVPDTPDINISSVEVDDDETNVYFRLNVTGSVSTTHIKGRRTTYAILLDYDQDKALDHTLFLEDGVFLWDDSTLLTNSSFSGSSIEWVVPKSVETDSIFTLQAATVIRARVRPRSIDSAPADGCFSHEPEWSSSYVWQVGVDAIEPNLTDLYSDYGLDTNGDGKFEYLAIDVEINATAAGNYFVAVYDLTNSTHTIPVHNTTDAGYLTEGLYNITVLLPGTVIFSSRTSGPHTLAQVLLRCYPYSDAEYQPYTTSFYNYRQFSAPPACFADTYSDAGVDLNGNGRFEWLKFTIGVNVTIGGTYTVGIRYLLDSLGHTIYPVWASTTPKMLEPGVRNVGVQMYGRALFYSGASGPYTISHLYLEDSASNLLDWRDAPYTTVNAYSYADFEAPAIITNSILKVSIEYDRGGEGIGAFAIKTDVGHHNPGENVFFGGAAESPWPSFTTIRVEDAFIEYVTSTDTKTPSSGYTVQCLDDYSPVVTRVSDTRATISWTTAESLLVTLLIDIRGTTLVDTIVQVTVTIQNDDTIVHSVAVRHEWDLMTGNEDDSWIRVWTDPSTPQSWTETETDWISPTFQFWETTNNPTTPVFSIYGSTVLPNVDPPPTVPDRLVYAAWGDCYGTAYDFAPSGMSGMDSAVLYYWNAVDIGPGGQISRTAYVTTVSERAQVLREPRSVYIVAEVAVVGAAVTASVAALASVTGLGRTLNSAVSRLPIPDELKEFLKLYAEKIFETVDKVKLEALENAPFMAKRELVALGVSAVVMTMVFGFVEANGLPRFLDPSVLAAVIPSTLISVCAVSIAGELFEAFCARTCRVYRQFRLWMYGLGAFLFSSLLFLFPFASPGITRYQCGEISDKTKGLIILSKLLLLLTLTAPFAGLFILGFKIVGDAGLLLTLITVCYSLVPLKPLAGKAVFHYRKEVSLIALLSVGIVFYSCTTNLLPHSIYIAVGVVSAFLAAFTLNELRKAHSK